RRRPGERSGHRVAVGHPYIAACPGSRPALRRCGRGRHAPGGALGTQHDRVRAHASVCSRREVVLTAALCVSYANAALVGPWPVEGTSRVGDERYRTRLEPMQGGWSATREAAQVRTPSGALPFDEDDSYAR